MTSKMKDIRDMSKYLLELYLHKHKNINGVFEVYLRLLNGKISEDDRKLASRIVYAQNRLRIMGGR